MGVNRSAKTPEPMNPGPNQRHSGNANNGKGKKLRLKIPDVTMSHALSRKVTTEKRRGD